MKASPIENYSSLHELSLIELIGWNIPWLRKSFFVEYNFNMHTPLKILPKTYVAVHTKDAEFPPNSSNYAFSINNLKRWRLDISSYDSLDDYISKSKRWHRCNFTKSKKNFENYGCETTFIEGDWTEHVEKVYQLYTNVAHHFQHWLYDLNFFQEIARRPDYKLLCAWYKGEMIGVFVLQEELPTLHSICCGLDYQHSSDSYAYTWMHYALFEHIIPLKKYHNVDVGLSADDAKSAIGFKPVASRMDIYSKGLTQHVLKVFSRFVTASITPDSKLKLEWKRSKSQG